MVELVVWGGDCTASTHVYNTVCSDTTPNCIFQQFLTETCTTYDDGESEGGTGGGTSGGGTGTGGGGGTDPVYSDPVPDNNYIAAYNENDPCNKIKSGTNNFDYKQKFKDLNKNEKFELNYESGFAKINDQYVDCVPGEDGMSLSIPPNSKNATHVHNNKPRLDENGNSYDANIKMLSIADIVGLIGMQPNNTSPIDSFLIMASNEGIFAISIIDNISYPPIERNLLIKLQKWQIEYQIQAKFIIENYFTATSRKNALEKLFLKGLKEVGLSDKIALFEGEVENESDLNINNYNIKWTRKTLEKGFLGNIVNQTPCN